jgi:hypothetical protein
MRYWRVLILAAAIQLPVLTFAQELGYSDAENSCEGVGMIEIKTRLHDPTNRIHRAAVSAANCEQ